MGILLLKLKKAYPLLILVLIISCSDNAENKISSLKTNWEKKDTVSISPERLQLRFNKALNYIKTYQLFVEPDQRECFSKRVDVPKEKSSSFFVVQEPLLPRKNEFLKSYKLTRKWSCKVFEKPFDSLMVQKSKYIGSYSKENELLEQQASSLFNSVYDWQKRNQERLTNTTTKILSTLPTDTSKSQFAIFELPTGNTITAYTTFYHNHYEVNQFFKTDPDYILDRTISANEVFFIFNDEDEIENIWISHWIK